MPLSNFEYVLLALAIILLRSWLVGKRRPGPLPPGPKGLPLIGNLLDVPTEFEWTVFSKWAEKWGDLLSVSVFGTTIIVVNSYSRAMEMLSKKSDIYSDRPHVPMPMDLMEMKESMGFLAYDKRFKSSRRLFHQELGSSSAVVNFFPQEEVLAKRFIKRVLHNPAELLEHCFQHAGAIILLIGYGYQVEEPKDPMVELATKAMENFNAATTPGAFLVNQLPILLKVPDWFPGAGFKKLGKLWAKDYWAMVDTPFSYVKQQLAQGTADDSFTARWLRQKISFQEELDLKFASSSMFGAGSETTSVTIYVFYLLMCLYPEVQKRAQAEIDAVVGRDRLPTFEDKAQCPYLDAVCKEVLRFHSSVPNCLPHCVKQDDIHDGMFIPKDSIILVNIWYMTHDPNVYKDPSRFNPDRFLGESPEQDPRDFIFGFGRRLCPGRLLADASVYITLASTLSAFNITPIEGQTPVYRMKTGIVSHIEPFECNITPRMDVGKLARLLQ
ncbi:cytochrome P450 [Mycena floridula]|nr:cytochrome P450 [Mycena floridula]